MLLIGLMGGLFSGVLGLGGGTIFNPMMLAMGVNPVVANSTGMYMVMFSTLSSSILFIISGTLNITFGLWIGAFTSATIAIG